MRQSDQQHKARAGETEDAPVIMETAAPEVEGGSWQLEPRPTRPTINDVARRCGLSKATISKALNLSEAESPVNAQTRRMVLQVAEEMGYRPNFRARSLTHGRSHAIGLLHERPAPNINGVYDGMIYAFAQTLLESGFHLTLVPTVGDAKDWSHALLDARLDGCMLFNALTPELHHVLTQAQLPTVLLNVGLNSDELNRDWPCLCVDPDDAGGTELVTRHLLELGHRRIAFVENLSPDAHPSRARRRGRFLEVMRRAGFENEAQLCIEPVADFAARFIEKPSQRPTAVIAYDHTDAILLTNQLWQRGVQVPRDLSLAGFNDVYPVAHLTPPLTMVRVPSVEMGREAARLLLGSIREGALPEQRHLLLPETLVMRQSTASA